MRRSSLVGSLLVAAAAGGLAEGPPNAITDDPLLARARALHRQAPLIDGHNDYPWAVREQVPTLDLAQLDIRNRQAKTMTDIPRLRAGGVGGQFWSVYVPSSHQGKDALRLTLEQIDIVHRMVRRYPDTFELARTAAGVERIFRSGRIASLVGLEGGHSIEGSLGVLRTLHALGAKYMTLTHSENVPWADAATDEPEHDGLTEFGVSVVAEMNRLGMLVDLSHVSPATMADAIEASKAPVIFSHSSARALCDHPRNVPDDILRRVAANRGVVMVTFVPSFVSPDCGQYYGLQTAERARLKAAHPGDSAAVQAGLEAFFKANPGPPATLAQVADHVDHVRRIAGIDHVGIGSDFDGITKTPAGLEDVSTYPALTAELLRRGYTDEDVKKVIGLNVLRAMREADAVAARATVP